MLSNHQALLELLPRENVDWQTYQGHHESARELALYLTHEDVYLDKFYDSQNAIRRLKAGSSLQLLDWGCRDQQGNSVIVFSKSFKNRLQGYLHKGYQLDGASVNFNCALAKERLP